MKKKKKLWKEINFLIVTPLNINKCKKLVVKER